MECGEKELPSCQNTIPGYTEYWIKDKVFCRNTVLAQTSSRRLWGCWVSVPLVSSAALAEHSQGWTSPLPFLQLPSGHTLQILIYSILSAAGVLSEQLGSPCSSGQCLLSNSQQQGRKKKIEMSIPKCAQKLYLQ